MKVAISFAVNANLSVVNEQLESLAKIRDYEFYSCFIPESIIKKESLDTRINDLFYSVLGDRMQYMDNDSLTLEEFRQNLERNRRAMLDMVDKMFVLDSRITEGVISEVNLFTRGRVVLL